MSRTNMDDVEELSLEEPCDCGAAETEWCRTASGGYTDKLHTRRIAGGHYCSAVEAYDCEAPAGYQVGGLGGGTCGAPGARPGVLKTCGYCGEPVCGPCSTLMTPPEFVEDQAPQPICLTHNEHELAQWLGLEGAA